MKRQTFALLVLFLFSILISFPLSAGEVNINMVRKVATIHLKAQRKFCQRPKEVAPNAQGKTYSIADIHTLHDNFTGRLLAYIVNLNPMGYIIVSTDTDIRPIIAYSFNSNFITQKSPQNMALYLLTLDTGNRLDAIPFLSQVIKLRSNKLWNNYQQDEKSFLRELETTDTDGPWLDTHWEQGDYFNDSCPIDPETGERCVVGCGPVAMGQIINYWEYPSSITFTPEESYYSTSTTPRIWVDAPSASMDTIDYNGDGSQPTRETVADLLFACGVSVQSSYSSDGTGSWVKPRHFMRKWGYGFASEMDASILGFYTQLVRNMRNAQPVMLTIFSVAGGHYIVCDGHRDTGEFHLNYGWGGFCDGWYFLPDSMPAGFTAIQSGIINIAPPRNPPITLRVPSEYATIQSAIDASLSGDTVLVASGRYNGFGNRDIDFGGRKLLLHSEEGAIACTLDCEGSEFSMHRGIYFHSGEDSDAVIDGFTIIHGYAERGGAIHCYNSSPTILNNILIGNGVIHDGGGISCSFSNALIRGNIIIGNSADNGGGIGCFSSNPSIVNNVIRGNSATETGGGIFLSQSSPSIINNTLYGNSASKGGGINSILSAYPLVLNSILWDNTAEDGSEIYLQHSSGYPCTLFVAYSDVETTDIVIEDDRNVIAWGNGNIDLEPQFSDSFLHLSALSPCIDAGTDSLYLPGRDINFYAPDADIDGNPRPWGIACDMGA